VGYSINCPQGLLKVTAVIYCTLSAAYQ